MEDTSPFCFTEIYLFIFVFGLQVQSVHAGLKQLNEEKCILAEDLRLLRQHFLQQLTRTECATLNAVCVIPNCLRRRSVKPLPAQTS